jgi:hypothetical protein
MEEEGGIDPEDLPADGFLPAELSQPSWQGPRPDAPPALFYPHCFIGSTLASHGILTVC